MSAPPHHYALLTSDAEARLQLALEVADMATYDWDMVTGLVVRSANAPRVLGVQTEGPTATRDEFMARVHPDDRACVLEAERRAFRPPYLFDVEYRIRRPDGSTTVVDFAMRAATIDERVLVLGVAIHAHVERDDNDRHAPAPLTAREREIVHLIALVHVSREICDMLHVAPDTVRTHVRNAMAKTGARTRAQLIAIALGDGLLEP